MVIAILGAYGAHRESKVCLIVVSGETQLERSYFLFLRTEDRSFQIQVMDYVSEIETGSVFSESRALIDSERVQTLLRTWFKCFFTNFKNQEMSFLRRSTSAELYFENLSLFSSIVPGLYGDWKSGDAPYWNPHRHRPSRGDGPAPSLSLMIQSL